MREPLYATSQVRLYLGEVREVLREMDEGSVHCVVTSPPYWNLRDYGTATWAGGDAECDHVAGMARQDTNRETPGGRGGSFRGGEIQYRANCGKCGAERQDSQLGLEDTPDEFIDAMVDVFREVRRVLRDDGTLWLNIGDTWATRPYGEKHSYDPAYNGRNRGQVIRKPKSGPPPGIKAKDMVGIPWMLAFALRADGWYLRQDIIWHKMNVNPESIKDRCTKSHEYLFLLTKKPTYFYDSDAIREPASVNTHARASAQGIRAFNAKRAGAPDRDQEALELPGVSPKAAAAGFGTRANESFSAATVGPVDDRNKRDVWSIASAGFSEAHFATFPPDLVKPCIAAGTSEGGVCMECGAPLERVVEIVDAAGRLGSSFNDHVGDLARGMRGTPPAKDAPIRRTVGWKITCACPDLRVTVATVLDPFIGSGTTAMVAASMGRYGVGIDLNPEYLEMASRRCAQLGLFTEGGVQ